VENKVAFINMKGKLTSKSWNLNYNVIFKCSNVHMGFLFSWSWFESLNIHIEEGNAKNLRDLWIEDYTLGQTEKLWHHKNNCKLFQIWS
jgi:hypothetical protein